MPTAEQVRDALCAAGFERSRRGADSWFTAGFHEQKVHGRPLLRITAHDDDEEAATLAARRMVHALAVGHFFVTPNVGAVFTVRLDLPAD